MEMQDKATRKAQQVVSRLIEGQADLARDRSVRMAAHACLPCKRQGGRSPAAGQKSYHK